MARRATIKDVAERAGVSTATVARVLHGKGYVANETREVVAAAIQQTGYQINAIAQGLRRQRTFTLGHVLHCIIPNPFFAGVELGGEQEASRHGCSVLMYNTQGNAERERLGVETLIQRRVDAVIFTTAIHEENVELALSAAIPVVQVERMTAVNTFAVTVDNAVGSRAAVEHLIGLGHQHIAYIGVDPNDATGSTGTARRPNIEQERLSGYLNALRAHDLPVDDDLIALGRDYAQHGDYTANEGYSAMWQFLSRQSRPTAVFATCDILAAGALQAIHEWSLRVPDDISVVGFDDTYASYLAPPLTTVEQPMVAIGKTAAGLIFRNLHQPAGETSTDCLVRLPTRLIIRASTGPAPEVVHVANRHDFAKPSRASSMTLEIGPSPG